MKPFVYYREERNANGELIDKEYNGINQFNGGRFGKPLYTAEQIEAAVLAEREACAKLCEQLGALNTATPQNTIPSTSITSLPRT